MTDGTDDLTDPRGTEPAVQGFQDSGSSTSPDSSRLHRWLGAVAEENEARADGRVAAVISNGVAAPPSSDPNPYAAISQSEPSTAASPAKRPASLRSVHEAPAADQPAVSEPAANEPAVNEPAVDEPAVNGAALNEVAVDQPAVEEVTAMQPAVKEATAKELAAKKPAVKAPAVKEATTKKPAAKKPAVKAPAVKKPAVKKPAVKEPSAIEPAPQEPSPKEPGTPSPPPVEAVAAPGVAPAKPAAADEPTGSPWDPVFERLATAQERAAILARERPEVVIGAAFGGGLILATILKRLGRR